MKIVVQNGSKHPISRKEMDCIVKLLPSNILKGISAIALYGASKTEPYVTYHPNDSSIGFHAYSEQPTSQIKAVAIQELIVALVAIYELGDIPKKISKSKQQQYLSAYNSVFSQCMQVINNAAT